MSSSDCCTSDNLLKLITKKTRKHKKCKSSSSSSSSSVSKKCTKTKKTKEVSELREDMLKLLCLLQAQDKEIKSLKCKDACSSDSCIHKKKSCVDYTSTTCDISVASAASACTNNNTTSSTICQIIDPNTAIDKLRTDMEKELAAIKKMIICLHKNST
jgi:hypothetical protein